MKNRLVIAKDGTKRWFKDDRRHREDGPAVEWVLGLKEWYFKDIFVGEGDAPDPVLWERLTSVEANGGSLLNGCIVDADGVEWWLKDDKLHREDGPASTTYQNTNWYFHGEHLGWDGEGFWKLWDLLTPEQRGSPTLLRYLPR